MENKPLTVQEAEDHLTIGISTLRHYLRQGLLSYIVLPGNDHQTTREELDAFKKARTIPRKDRK